MSPEQQGGCHTLRPRGRIGCGEKLLSPVARFPLGTPIDSERSVVILGTTECNRRCLEETRLVAPERRAYDEASARLRRMDHVAIVDLEDHVRDAISGCILQDHVSWLESSALGAVEESALEGLELECLEQPARR